MRDSNENAQCVDGVAGCTGPTTGVEETSCDSRGCRTEGLGALPRGESAMLLPCLRKQPLSVLGAKAPYSNPHSSPGTRRRDGECGGAVTSPSPALQAYATVTVKPSGSPKRLLKVGAVVLISGAVLLLFGAIGAFYFWKGNDNHVSSKSGSSWDTRAARCQGGRTPSWSQSAGRPVGTACCSLRSPSWV